MLNHYQIIRRNGAVVPFEPSKIAVALMKAFLAVHGTQGAANILQDCLTTGNAATGISSKMVRHYEAIGLLPPAGRTGSA